MFFQFFRKFFVQIFKNLQVYFYISASPQKSSSPGLEKTSPAVDLTGRNSSTPGDGAELEGFVKFCKIREFSILQNSAKFINRAFRNLHELWRKHFQRELFRVTQFGVQGVRWESAANPVVCRFTFVKITRATTREAKPARFWILRAWILSSTSKFKQV